MNAINCNAKLLNYEIKHKSFFVLYAEDCRIGTDFMLVYHYMVSFYYFNTCRWFLQNILI